MAGLWDPVAVALWKLQQVLRQASLLALCLLSVLVLSQCPRATVMWLLWLELCGFCCVGMDVGTEALFFRAGCVAVHQSCADHESRSFWAV